MKQIDKKKILVVDDEPSVRLLAKKSLSENYIVLEAENGRDAIDMACNWKPDLILMDIHMPEVDGLAACYAIKTDEATKATPVAMLTGVGYELNKKLSYDIIGADGYLTKPFSLQDLRDTVDRLLGTIQTEAK